MWVEKASELRKLGSCGRSGKKERVERKNLRILAGGGVEVTVRAKVPKDCDIEQAHPSSCSFRH